MSFALRPGKPITRELKRIARKELGGASKRLLQDHRDDDDVHEGRKSVKKVEALAKVLDQIGVAPPRKDVKRLREVRRTFDHLRSRFAHRIPEHTSAIIRTHLSRRKSQMTHRAQAGSGRLTRAGRTLRKIRRSAKQWVAPSIDVAELPDVLRRTFRASRKAMKRAQTRGRAADFHEWRKRVKDLWYQLRLAERLVSGLGSRIEEFRALETALGEEHNLVVLRTKLTRERGLRNIKSHINRITAMSTAVQQELRRSALVLGTQLQKLTAKQFAKDLRRRLRPKGTPRRRPSLRTRAIAVS
jgi:CHAD domain-containing protein